MEGVSCFVVLSIVPTCWCLSMQYCVLAWRSSQVELSEQKLSSFWLWMASPKLVSFQSKSEETEDLVKHIPEDLLGLVFWKIPYPSLFKVRLLSRIWNAKFVFSLRASLPAHLRCEVEKGAARWPSYAPVYLFGRHIVAFDASSQSWRKLDIQEFDGFNLLGDSSFHWNFAFAGSLVCAVGRSNFKPLHVIVANTLTGSFKVLPSPPEHRDSPITDFRFVHVDSRNYRLLVHDLPAPQFKAYVYESSQSSRGWISLYSTATIASRIPGLNPFSAYTDGYIDETLHCLNREGNNEAALWIFSKNDRAWRKLVRFEQFESNEYPGGLFKCGSRYIIVTLTENSTSEGNISVVTSCIYELNLQNLLLLRLARSPPNLTFSRYSFTLLADKHRIFFCYGPNQSGWEIISFNLKNGSWTRLPPTSPSLSCQWGRFSVYEPGLNPFASP